MIHYKGRLLSAICGLTLSLSLASSALAAPVVAPTTAGEQKPPAASEPVGVEKQSQTATEPAKIPQEDAIRIARETFSIPAEFGMPSVHYYSSERPSPVQTYYVNWSSPNHLASIRENFNVEIDASTGFVRSFNHYRYDPTNPGAMPKYRYDEAKMMAKEWLGKIQPSLIDQLRQDQALADEVQGRESLSYRWYRLVNG
ncbi:MAG: hypothetical protein ACM3ZQ_11455, partial [Bacillota bacterium]